MLGENFSEEIATNRQAYAANNIPLPTISWQDLAGRAWNEGNPEANARIGLDQTYEQWRTAEGLSELGTVLQRFNASNADWGERLRILNEWLEEKEFVDLQDQYIALESWPHSESAAARIRWGNIGWIPSGSFNGVLLPRDEQCQQIRNMPGDCDDRPRR